MKLTRTYLKQLIKEELEAPAEEAPAEEAPEGAGDGGLEGGSQALKAIGAYLPKITRKEDYLKLFRAVMKVGTSGKIGVSPAPELKAMFRGGEFKEWLGKL